MSQAVSRNRHQGWRIPSSMVETSQTQAFVREREHLLHLRDALDRRDDIFTIVDRCDSVHEATSQMMSLL